MLQESEVLAVVWHIDQDSSQPDSDPGNRTWVAFAATLKNTKDHT